MPSPYPKEFRRDVVAFARRGEQSRAQVARSFGISESCPARWLSIANREDGLADPATPASGADEQQLRDLVKRNKQLEQEGEILRRATAYFARWSLTWPLTRSTRTRVVLRSCQASSSRGCYSMVHRYPPDAVEFPRDSAAFTDRRQRADGMRIWTDPATVLVGGQPTLTLDARWVLTAGGYRRMYALEAWVPRPYGLINLRSHGPEEGIALGRGAFLTALGSWTWYR